ncbi:iron chelate uptake ABC transporter family permease subunit [Cytophagaceae bacterium ABcell3]|nr:iron chelate uptake ABC transporter family permease subunit [Cytophagaceae bacterium ABcell3]
MDKLITFLSLSDPNVRYVVIGSTLLMASSAVAGCFTFLRKRSLTGDAVAHAVLPGICLAFMLSGQKDPLMLLIGAFATGWLSLIAMDFINGKTKLKEDTTTGLVLSVFFGIGVLLLTIIQQSGAGNQSGLDTFLFGKAAAMKENDLLVFGTTGSLILLTVIVFFRELTIVSFDPNFARAIGMPIRLYELILTTITVLAVVIGIQATGVVLMAAMLISPAAAARFWTHKLPVMILLAAIMGAFSGISGAYISYVYPTMPTGPWIVVIISLIALGSFLLAPGKGILARLSRQRENRKKIMEENVLKVFFHLGEPEKDFFKPRTQEDLLNKRDMDRSQLNSTLYRLKSDGYLKQEKNKWMLTNEGFGHGKRVTRLHRLWEMYLSTYMNIAPDHVHDDAETMEHIITPELEQKLEQQLGFPLKDPHDSDIPYKGSF